MMEPAPPCAPQLQQKASWYLRRLSELRRENERLKRELATLQKRLEGAAGGEPEEASPQLQPFIQMLQRLQCDSGNPALLGSLVDLHRSLERKLQEVDPRLNEQAVRSLVVETMRLSLELWQECTKSSKAELARRSGQWSVYVNQDGWERTQGFDRYLDIVTLPDNPRMRKVLRTADFVLQYCLEPPLLRRRLEEALFTLRALQRSLVVTS